MLQLLLEDHRRQLLENGARSARGEQIDPYPVVKLFTPDAGAVWLLTELDPDDPDIGFGLCDLGLGYPELGSVRLTEIEALRGNLRLPVERDEHFYAYGPLSAYAAAARRAERIVCEATAIMSAQNAGRRVGPDASDGPAAA
jgi:hypothetical protein